MAKRETSPQPSPADLERVIFNPICVKILRFLAERGKATQTEVAREIDCAPASARHYLLRMARVGMVAIDGTRPGPKGIIERLFEIPKDAAGNPVVTSGGAAEQAQNLELRLNTVLESHRVARRILRKDPNRSWGMSYSDLELSPREMARLGAALAETAKDFVKKLPKKTGEAPGDRRQHLRHMVVFFPQHPPRKAVKDDRHWNVVLGPKEG
jgi:hypothetical protein